MSSAYSPIQKYGAEQRKNVLQREKMFLTQHASAEWNRGGNNLLTSSHRSHAAVHGQLLAGIDVAKTLCVRS